MKQEEWVEVCQYISDMTDRRLSELSNFIRYCEKQRDAADTQGFHDTALYIQECIDDLKGK